MKVQECDGRSLLNGYYPVDYEDSFSRVVCGAKELTPDDFLNLTFSTYPKWVAWLLALRTKLVKPLGLKTGGSVRDSLKEQNSSEIIVGEVDKHLTFYCSLWCSPKEGDRQLLRITTVVKYNNLFGRLYFFVIRPFHKVIVYCILKRATHIASTMK